MTSTTDARGITVTRTVDALDRVTFVDYPDDTLDTTHVYDHPAVPFSLGRLTAITRDGHTVAYAYDQYGRTVQDGELSYQYDRNGNRTNISYPDDVSATMTHDYADRKTTLSVTTPSGTADVITAATYLPSGPLTTLTFGTGVTETRIFDQRYFPASIALDAARDRTWTYTQDAVGNVTEIVSSLACPGDVTLSNQTVTGEVVEDSCAGLQAGPAYTVDTGADVTFRAATRVVLSDGFSVKSGASFTAGVAPSLSGDVTRSYTYQDVEYFLTEATGPWSTKSWTFDKIGNRLTETDGDGTDTYSYTQNPAAGGNTALLDSIALPTLGSRDYSYSDAGHQTRVASSTGGNVVDFTYGNDGRLSQADRTGADPTPLLYDGRSFLRHAGDLATTGTVQPLYDSAGLLHGLLRQSSDTDPETRYLIFYLAGRPVAQVALEAGQADRWWYFHTDHLGTPLVATDGVGEELWANRFEPYGRDMDAGLASGALESGVFLRFPGQWEHQIFREATLGARSIYNVYRWYSLDTGRYLGPDPLGLSGGFNRYRYASASPVVYGDALGLYCTSDFVRHYFNGGGSRLDLPTVGLLDDFQSAPPVRRRIRKFKRDLYWNMVEEIRRVCRGCTTIRLGAVADRDSLPVNVTDEPCPFAVGHTNLRRSGLCSFVADCPARTFSFRCGFEFSIHDEFADPLDIFDWFPGNLELPGGQPYDIGATWRERNGGTGTF